MLKRFAVKNYKNFKDEIDLDFSKVGSYHFSTDCLYNNLIAKLLIYGRNATGKTNFVNAISDVKQLIWDTGKVDETPIINAESHQTTADFTYTFVINREELTYNYSRQQLGRLSYEELTINGTLVYCCDFLKNEFKFPRLDLIQGKGLNTDSYTEPLNKRGLFDLAVGYTTTIPFLRWAFSNTVMEAQGILGSLLYDIAGISVVLAHDVRQNSNKKDIDSFYELLKDKERLTRFEKFLNQMGVECKLKLEELPDGRNELYFDYGKLVPFYLTASSGTLALTNLYRRIFVDEVHLSVLMLDEFDAFYHHELAEMLVRYIINNYRDVQVVMTTHNTNLMTNSLMRPDCLFILSRDGRLTPLNRATQRELREGHNLEKMYISGEFAEYE